MQGTHVSSESATVQDSTVSAVKIRDTTTIGTLSLEYELNGFVFDQEGLNVSCFAQSKGTTELLFAPVSFAGESARFSITVDNNGTNEELSLSVFTPTDINNDLEINLNFAVSGDEIEGENTGNTSAEYQPNSNSAVHLNANVVDDITPSNTATFGLEINL